MSHFVISQILGGVALIITCVGYFFKHKDKFLASQIFANLFYALSFIAQQSYVGGIITFVSIVRCIYIFICDKKNFKYTAYFLPIFVVCYIVIAIIFFKGYSDIMPIITATTFTIAFVIKDLQTIRYVCIFPNALLVVYNILCKTYTNAVLDFIEVIVLLVAIVKYIMENKKEKVV